MLLPPWVWVFASTFALFMALIALALSLACRRRIDSIVKDASSVADLASKKIHMDAQIEQCMKTLDEHREELQKLESERRQQQALRQELAALSTQVSQERQKRDEYRKEVTDLENAISGLKKDLYGVESEKTDGIIEEYMAEEQLDAGEDASSVVKLRVKKRHRLRV